LISQSRGLGDVYKRQSVGKSTLGRVFSDMGTIGR
jgi:hypothetical protein